MICSPTVVMLQIYVFATPDNDKKGENILMRSPTISFLLLLSLIMPLSACAFGGGEAEEGSENTEQKKEDDDDDD